MSRQAYPYRAYVLRLWRDGPAAPWRAVLECARTGERHAFACLVDLYAFLDAETGAVRAPTLARKAYRREEESQMVTGMEKGEGGSGE